MSRYPTSLFRRAVLAGLVALGISAAAEAQPAPLDARLDRLSQALDLTPDQSAALDAVAASDAGDAWAAAAAARDVLTDDQIETLRAAAELRQGQRGVRGERGGRRARGGRGERVGRRGGRGMRSDRAQRGRSDGRRGRRGGIDRQQLTDEQRQAIREIREESRDQRRALVQRFRDGDLTDDAFAAQSRALRASQQQRMAEALPAEMASRLAERQSRREASRQAREQALGLSDAQREQIAALRLDRIRQAPDRLDVRPFLDDDGVIDRQAMRRAQRERREQTRQTRRAQREAMQDVLTDDQEAVVLLHRYLSGPRRGRR